MKGQLTTLVCLFLATTIYGQDPKPQKREFQAKRITGSVKIDGILDDDVYKNAPRFKGKFFQIEPNNGAESKFENEIYILYDDNSIYIGAKLYDENPELIPMTLIPRDNFNGNSDILGIIIDTYNKGQNGAGFFVTSAGVQTDIQFSQNNEDGAWNGVWDSAVQLVDDGWIVEMEIPYFNLRFPKVEDQLWGLNFYRVSKRFQEESSWNFIDQAVDGWINQSGTLTGVNNIKPPVRLSLMPYLSAIYKKDGATGISKRNLAGGMDLKYGINESFTVDVTLIPDFSQVRSDNLVLNLSPFEVQFDENRPFFTEGTEMFSKGRVFYSRRVGQTSRRFDSSQMEENEELVSLPGNTPLINATKISGRTQNGMGLGIFNAMTNKSFAVVRNTTTGVEREVMVDPFTNFNVAVLDQNLRNNSNFGIINTNVRRSGVGRDANVTYADMRLRDKTNTWNFYMGNGFSMQMDQDAEGNVSRTIGHKNVLSFGKVSGNFQFGARRFVESDSWNINDLGFNRANNNIENNFDVSYNIFKPFSIFNRLNVEVEVEHSQLYAPREFTGLNVAGFFNVQFKNFMGLGGRYSVNPTDNFDFWEPRVAGRFFRTGPSKNMNLFFFSDDRKPFRFMGYTGQWRREEDGAKANWLGMDPSYRVSDKLTVRGSLGAEMMRGTKGFVNFDENENIIFGTRDITEISAQLNFEYTFNPMMNLSLRIRNYWSRVEYDRFHILNEQGRLADTDYQGIDDNGNSLHNANFDAFNIDLFYNWQVAPGSFFSVGYKLGTSVFDNVLQRNYWTNLDKTLKEPGLTTLSARLIYFLDYSTIVRGRN